MPGSAIWFTMLILSPSWRGCIFPKSTMGGAVAFSIKGLYELQVLDWKISAREESLEEVRAKLQDDSAVMSAGRRVEELVSQFAAPSSARRQVELAVKGIEEKLKRVEERLYGGTVTNPRELSAYEEERSFLTRQLSEEEDKLLELMVKVDELRSARGEARQSLKRLKAEREARHPEWLKAEERLVEELDGLRRERAGVVGMIPPSVLATYESLRRSRNGMAVAKVERGMCQGCRLSLPTRELQRARGAQEVVQCSSCRRILYVA